MRVRVERSLGTGVHRQIDRAIRHAEQAMGVAAEDRALGVVRDDAARTAPIGEAAAADRTPGPEQQPFGADASATTVSIAR